MGKRNASDMTRLSAIETLAPILRPAKVYMVDAKPKEAAAPRAEISPTKFSRFFARLLNYRVLGILEVMAP